MTRDSNGLLIFVKNELIFHGKSNKVLRVVEHTPGHGLIVAHPMKPNEVSFINSGEELILLSDFLEVYEKRNPVVQTSLVTTGEPLPVAASTEISQ